MNFNLPNLTPSQTVWGILIVLGLILAYVVIRFFWVHIIKYLFHGCLVILGLILVIALLQYFKIIQIPWPF
jgi:hypothetical protein